MKNIYSNTTFKILLVGFLLIALFFTFYDSLIRNTRQIEENLEAITNESNTLLNTTISEKLKDEMQILKSYAALLENAEEINADSVAIVEPLLKHDLFTRVALTDASGISYTSDHFQHDSSNRSYYKEAMKGKDYISNKITSAIDQSEIIVMSVPIWQNEEVIGVLRATLNIETLYEYFSLSVLSGNVSSNIIQSDGTNLSQLANQDANFFHLLESNGNDAALADQVQEDLLAHKNGSLHFTLNGKVRYAYYSHIAKTDWSVISILPYSLVEEQVRIDLNRMIVLACKISLILILFGAYVFYMKRKDAQKIKAMNRQLDTIISNTPGAAFKHELHNIASITLFQKQGHHFLGYTKEKLLDLIKNHLDTIIHPDDYAMFLETSKDMRPGKIYTFTYRIYDAQHHMQWYYDQRQIVEEDGKWMCYVEVINITDLKIAQEQLKISEERYQLILQEAKSIIFEWNIDKDCIQFSNQWVSEYGYPIEINNFLVHTQRLFQDQKDSYIPLIEELLKTKESRQIDCILPKANGDAAWVRILAKPLLDDDGYILRVIGSIRDISEEKQTEMLLQKQAQQDGLTQLYNRSAIETKINQMMKKSPYHHHLLFVMDIDDFKGINDTYGHSAGDEALQKVSAALRSSLRASDLIGRIGGDEFVIFISLHKAWSDAQIQSKCEMFLHALAQIHLTKDPAYAIRSSIGVGLSPEDGTTYHDLFNHADARLYIAKKQGKNTFIFK